MKLYAVHPELDTAQIAFPPYVAYDSPIAGVMVLRGTRKALEDAREAVKRVYPDARFTDDYQRALRWAWNWGK